MYKNPMWVSGDLKAGEFFEAVTRRFSDLMSSTKMGDAITVFINSKGGDTYTALGLYDLLSSELRNSPLTAWPL